MEPDPFVSKADASAITNQVPPDFRPFGTRVLLKYIPPETNGILLPDTVNQQSMTGGNWARVIAVGPGIQRPDGTWQEVALKPGWKVLLPNYEVLGIKLNGEYWIVCHEQDLLGRLVEPNEMTEDEFREKFLAPLTAGLTLDKFVSPPLSPDSPAGDESCT